MKKNTMTAIAILIFVLIISFNFIGCAGSDNAPKKVNTFGYESTDIYPENEYEFDFDDDCCYDPEEDVYQI